MATLLCLPAPRAIGSTESSAEPFQAQPICLPAERKFSRLGRRRIEANLEFHQFIAPESVHL